MIDVHTHLLPGVDDGSPSPDVSIPVLERFAQDGVQVVVCTPHLDASRANHAPYVRHVEILAALRARAPASPALRLGWELMLDTPGDVTPRARACRPAGERHAGRSARAAAGPPMAHRARRRGHRRSAHAPQRRPLARG